MQLKATLLALVLIVFGASQANAQATKKIWQYNTTGLGQANDLLQIERAPGGGAPNSSTCGSAYGIDTCQTLAIPLTSLFGSSPDGSVSTPGFAFGNAPNTGFFRNTANGGIGIVAPFTSFGKDATDNGYLGITRNLTTGAYPDGSPSNRAGYLTKNAPAVFQSETFGCEADAVTLSVMSNALPRTASPTLSPYQFNAIQVMGGLCSGNFYNTYGGLDSVATFFSNSSPAPVKVDTNATFDATHVYFSTYLTSSQIAATKIGMVVRTNPMPITTGSTTLSPFQSVITAVAPNGSSITVQQWAQPGDPTGTSVGKNPMGYAGATGPYTALVGIVYNIYANNTIVSVAPGGGQDYTDAAGVLSERSAIAYEILVDNGYTTNTARSRGLLDPAFDLPYALGIHINANGNDSVAFRTDKGTNILDGHTTTFWQFGFLDTGSSFAGFDVMPSGATNPSYGYLDERLQSNGGMPFAYVPQNYGTPGATQKWGVDATGTEWPSGIAFPDGTLHPTIPLATIYQISGTPGSANSGQLHLLASSYNFYDPTGAYQLQLQVNSSGAHFSTGGGPIIFGNPVTTTSSLQIAGFAVSSLPSGCLIGQRLFALNGRKPGEGAGVGSGVPVICSTAATGATEASTGNWYSEFSGATVTQ